MLSGQTCLRRLSTQQKASIILNSPDQLVRLLGRCRPHPNPLNKVREGLTFSASHFLRPSVNTFGASQVALVVKNPPANTGDIRDAGSIPELGRSPGEGSGNSLQYFCLENPMDRGAWQATAHRVTKSWTRLKQLSTYILILPPMLITAIL